MADGMPREMPAGRRLSGRGIPPESPGTAHWRLALAKGPNGLRGKQRRSGFSGGSKAVDNLACKAQKIGDIGEEAGVAGNAIENPGILILNLALDGAMAEGGIDFSRWNRPAQLAAGAENGRGHTQWAEDLLQRRIGQRLVCEHFKSFA